MPHARSLTLTLGDGLRLIALLDQGFGAWRTEAPVRYDFRVSATAQAHALRRADFVVQAAEPGEVPLVGCGTEGWVIVGSNQLCILPCKRVPRGARFRLAPNHIFPVLTFIAPGTRSWTRSGVRTQEISYGFEIEFGISGCVSAI
jgi:hypothetical protein